MWWGSGPDPGSSRDESSNEPPQSQQLLDLQEQFEQQQTFIAQLKEMLRKTEQSSSVSREKVEEYASTLNEINARTKLSKIKRSEGKKSDSEVSSSKSTSVSKRSTIVTPAKEKINLLRQQLEENRVKLAERDKNQKDVEDMVNQLKAQLDESQAKINNPPIVTSKTESETVAANYSTESSKDDLLFALKSKDDYILELSNKIQQLQANVLDLQENVKEKDSVIDARTKAITLLSENLSKKGKDTLDLLDETKEQMRSMQQDFVVLESKMKEENIKLQSELLIKDKRIQELSEINSSLETNNLNHQEKLTNLNKLYTESENKISKLNKLNGELQSRIHEFEDTTLQTSSENIQQKDLTSPQKISKRKGSKKSRTKESTETTFSPSDLTYLNRIAELEREVEELKIKVDETKSTESDIRESDKILKLGKQLEEMNKSMIKMKAQHKAKIKEIQKKQTSTELNEKASTLESENIKLEQRIAELEIEKGNLQLRLVDYESTKEKEYIADLENKIEEQKMEIENHIRTITLLESQITTSSSELSALRSELANLMHIENAQVCSEMTSVQLEEQLDKEVSQKKEIQDKYNEIVKENENLSEKIETLNKEKQELSTKLEQYMQENIDLIDRLEKLSAEKVSSAESIEIVDHLTQQEKLEIEAYQKNLDFITDSDKPTDETDMEHSPELNETVSKLNEETSELMEKIKLFTVERREVMDKMENLSAENQQLISKLEKFDADKHELNDKYKQLCDEKESLISKINNLLTENIELKKLKYSGVELSDQSAEKIREDLNEYRAIIENQKLQISSLQEELWNKSDNEAEKSTINNKFEELNNSLNSQLRTLQAEYESLYTLHESAKEGSKELITANNRITELESKISENAVEISSLQSQIQIYQVELDHFREKILFEDKYKTNKDTKIEILEHELKSRNETIAQLNIEFNEKNKSHDETVSSLASQLSELKTVIADNFSQLENYEDEMIRNSETIDELNEKLEELNYKITETDHVTQIKNIEVNTLKQEKASCEVKIKSLEAELREKNDNFAETCRQLKEKCKFLENQIQINSGSIDDIKGPFETKISELETKNKELVEKMKKIAANLKKKSNLCQELETKLAKFKEKWENESKEKDEKQKIIDDQQFKLTESQNEIHCLRNQLHEIENDLSNVQLKFESKNNEIKELHQDYNAKMKASLTENNTLNNKVKALIVENSELQENLSQYAAIQETLQREIEEKNQQIQNLNLQINTINAETKSNDDQVVQNLLNQLETMKINHETIQNATYAKLQEKDLFIENLEAENVKYKERISKLEEALSDIEEKRQLLEKKSFDLKVLLEEKSFACEEAVQSENLLERRLSTLIAHDEIIEKKLEQSTVENETLNNKIKSLLEENDSLQNKLNEINLKLQETSANTNKQESLENEISRLSKMISNSENEMKKLQNEYERKLTAKHSEIENMETELNTQVQELQSERKTILNHCEILQDNIKEVNDNNELLSQELEKLQEKSIKMDQTLDEYRDYNEIYLARIENLENQVSFVNNITEGIDVHSLKTEVEHLQNIISQKDIDIQNYQRQNMQLQMSSFTPSPVASLFNIPSPEETEELKNKLLESNSRYSALEQQVHQVTEQIKLTENELYYTREKLSEIQNLYQTSQNELSNQKTLVLNLQQELANNQDMFVRKTAEQGVAEIISTAEKTVLENTENIQPIFEEISQKQKILQFKSPAEKLSVEVTKEELLRKIKALEFVLFNVEQEKEDTLAQCHEFTNELARLVYERENLIKDKPTKLEKTELSMDIESLENQIVSSSEVNDALLHNQNLQPLEFTPLQVQINKDNCENITPQLVAEDLIEPKTTYLCYAEDNKKEIKNSFSDECWGWESENLKIQESIESQILQPNETKIFPEDRKQIELLEYGQVNMPKDTLDNSAPVFDLIPDPKHAYLCHPSEIKNVLGEDTFASEEDGWGWNAEEAKLEAEHRMSVSASSIPPQIINSRVEQLEEKIHDLEVERTRLLEEIKSSQIRSGKLIKKLKLMKEKNDTLVAEINKKSSGDLCGLEMAIQDELNSQIKILEKKYNELSDENTKEKTERANLNKRLEVLNNANDRMVEMKEKQDNEIQFLQFKNRELSSKLEQLEWGDDSPNRSKTPTTLTITTGSEADAVEQRKQNEEMSKKIAELNSVINDLTLDNEEMQCMLEEQRNMRLEAEKALLNRPVPENVKSEQEFLKVEIENRNLHGELIRLTNVQQKLEDKFVKIEEENKNLYEELKKLQDAKQVLEDKIILYSKNNDELGEKSNNLQVNIKNLVEENKLLNNQYSAQIEQLQNENIELQNLLTNINSEKDLLLQNQVDPNQINQLQNENIQLQSQLSNLNIEKQALLETLMDANQNEIIQLKSEITRLEEENNHFESLLSEKEINLQNLNLKIHQLEVEKNSIETRLQEILNIQAADKTNDEKFQQMNEQLMTALTNLDNKNKEINELNNILTNDRLEAEQKLTLTIDQLVQQWTERVDQRGDDVAENWKLHLESVENEFSQKEETLREELNSLFKQNEELLSQNNILQERVQLSINEKETFVFDNNKKIENLEQCINSKQNEIINLSQNVKDKENEILNLTQNIKNKESEILELSHKLQEISADLQMKNSEIINLQLTFEQMQTKEIELENTSQQLHLKILECTDLQEKLNELNALSNEEEKQALDLKNIIENQVLKIEDLKKEIEQKNVEYSVLANEIVKFEETYLRPEGEKFEVTEEYQEGEEKIDPAKKAELDLALYMLHQRDVRCEELTVELMQLLEERDTLQLKLSNALRLNEELRKHLNVQSHTETQVQESLKSTGAIPKKSTAIILEAKGAELATEATENIITDDNTQPQDKDKDELADKLLQLQIVGYNRDKTLKDDQEIRHIQQMTIMQQHRDLAAKLPPEAAARLVDASYTVSRDVQSPSKVLLNWLWGRSTPKVNDI